MSHSKMPPNLKPEVPLSLISCITLAFAVMLLLPISQWITGQIVNDNPSVEPFTVNPPDDVVVKIDPPAPDKPIEIDKPKEDVLPPSISVMEDIMVDTNGIQVATNVGSLLPDWDDALDFVAFGDLTEKPRPTSRLNITYPAQEKAMRETGLVVALFEVKADGSVGKITIESTTGPAFSEAVIRALSRAQFEPGKKDGRAVATHVRQEFPFRLN